MNNQDLLDTLEDLMEVCSSQNIVTTDIFTVLISSLFLSDGHFNRDHHKASIQENLYRWFQNLKDVFQSHTNPSLGDHSRPSRSDLWLTKLNHYFVILSWNSLSFLYPSTCSMVRDSVSKFVEDSVDCLKEDLKEECYKAVTLVYSLYRLNFPDKVFYDNFSEFLATPEVPFVHKSTKRVRVIEEKLFSLFPNSVAESILVLAGNLRQSIYESENEKYSNLNINERISYDVSGWAWFSGNSKSIEEKLKFTLKVMRNYLQKGFYSKANAFNQE